MVVQYLESHSESNLDLLTYKFIIGLDGNKLMDFWSAADKQNKDAVAFLPTHLSSSFSASKLKTTYLKISPDTATQLLRSVTALIREKIHIYTHIRPHDVSIYTPHRFIPALWKLALYYSWRVQWPVHIYYGRHDTTIEDKQIQRLNNHSYEQFPERTDPFLLRAQTGGRLNSVSDRKK